MRLRPGWLLILMLVSPSSALCDAPLESPEQQLEGLRKLEYEALAPAWEILAVEMNRQGLEALGGASDADAASGALDRMRGGFCGVQARLEKAFVAASARISASALSSFLGAEVWASSRAAKDLCAGAAEGDRKAFVKRAIELGDRLLGLRQTIRHERVHAQDRRVTQERERAEWEAIVEKIDSLEAAAKRPLSREKRKVLLGQLAEMRVALGVYEESLRRERPRAASVETAPDPAGEAGSAK